MLTSYLNPWHTPGRTDTGPEVYTTKAPARPYKGFDIHHVHRRQWDVVKGGVCVHQAAGPNGARLWVDEQEEN